MLDVQHDAPDVHKDNPSWEYLPHCTCTTLILCRVSHNTPGLHNSPTASTSHKVATDAKALSPKEWAAGAKPLLGKALQQSGVRHRKPMSQHDA